MNSKLYKRLMAGAAALAFTVTGATAMAEQVVRIGLPNPLTGGSARLGKDSQNGARLAVDEINAKGLVINGQKIRLVLDEQDDMADPRLATQAAQKFVDDRVVAVVGHLNSGASIPASKIYHSAGIVQLSPATTDPSYTRQGYKTTYRLVGTDAQQGPALASYAAKTMKIRRVAVIDDSTSYGQGLANEFAKTAKSLGVKVLSHDATNDKAIDFRAILTKIKAENPDAIMYGGIDTTGGPLAKQARQLGLRAKILSGDGVCTESLPALAGNATGNVVCSRPGVDIAKMPGGAAFAAKYQRRYGHPIEFNAPFSYDGVYIIVDAMKRAHSTNPARVLAVMPSTNYRGVIGTTTFDAHGDLKHAVISIYDYRNGKRVLIDSIRM